MNDDGRRAPIDRVRITDGETLRRVLRALKEHHGGSRAAAQALGMIHSTFNRLLTGVTKTSMDRETYRQIREALAGHAIEFGLIDIFEGTVESGDFGFYRHRYQHWLDEEFERVEPLARPVLLALWELPDYRNVIQRHLRKATRSPDLPSSDQKRQWLALYRAVEPLSSETWGVERSWEDLHGAGQLRDYLRHALAAERIVLDREGDLERMTLRPPPEEFWAIMAGIDEPGSGDPPSDRVRDETVGFPEDQ